MILNYQSLKYNTSKLNDEIFNNKTSKPQIQKIYSTPHFLCLKVRTPLKNHCILLGRGGGYEGIWSSPDFPQSRYRVKDKFLEFSRKHLTPSRIAEVIIDIDRIVILRVFQKSIEKFFAVFWKGRDLYFLLLTVDEFAFKVFCSWKQNIEKIDKNDSPIKKINEIFDSIGRKQIQSSKMMHTKLTFDYLGYYKKIDLALARKNGQEKKIKFLLRKKSKISSDLTNLRSYDEIQNLLIGNKLDLSLNKIKFKGLKVNLGYSNNFYQKKDIIFNKIKSWKKGEKILLERLNSIDTELINLNKKESIHSINSIKIIAPRWYEYKPEKKPLVNKTVRFKEFKFSDGSTFSIGLDATSNDYLRNTWAHKADIWFHIEGEKGSHGIYKSSIPVDINKIEIIGSALITFSKIEKLSSNILYTQIKNVKGVKGRAGAVLHKHSKKILIYFKNDWNKLVMLVE
ncbi:MAG: hypothetical protein HOJ35_12215 [Bdellovibrionales bacterium]|jgi:predicted ribosome quality control (RQC) complex YloA/Tae2 family protein|nr:hypothetical protein [Bdellovibrionales bacterium]